MLVETEGLVEGVTFVARQDGGVLVAPGDAVEDRVGDAGDDVSDIFLEAIALARLALVDAEVVDLFFLADDVVLLGEEEVVVVVSYDAQQGRQLEGH